VKNTLEFSIPIIIAGLEEVARTIGQVIREEYKRKPVEKDLDQLYKNMKRYYAEVRKLKKEKDNAEELAREIERDNLFFFYVTDEKADKIVQALRAVASLSNKKSIVVQERGKEKKLKFTEIRFYRIKIIVRLLKCLEIAKNICLIKE
jgi:hypothetical protein